MSERIELHPWLTRCRGSDVVAWISYPEGRTAVRADGTHTVLEGEGLVDVDPADLVLAEILARVERRIDRLVRDGAGATLISLWLGYKGGAR